jgi:hypothetical protein
MEVGVSGIPINGVSAFDTTRVTRIVEIDDFLSLALRTIEYSRKSGNFALSDTFR